MRFCFDYQYPKLFNSLYSLKSKQIKYAILGTDTLLLYISNSLIPLD